MYRTMADEHKAEGRKEGEVRALQRTLLRLLRQRFGDLPAAISKTVKTTDDVKQLDAWLARTVSAATLAEMRMGPTVR